MENKIGYHICKDVGTEHVQIYEEVTFDNLGGPGITSSVVQSVTTYDHATDTVTSGSTVPEVEEAEQAAEQAAEQSAEIPQEDVEEPAEEPAEEQGEEQAEEPAEEMPQEDVEEAEEQPADAEEV